MLGICKQNVRIIAVIAMAVVMQIFAIIDLCHAGMLWPAIAFLLSEFIFGLVGYANLKADPEPKIEVQEAQNNESSVIILFPDMDEVNHL